MSLVDQETVFQGPSTYESVNGLESSLHRLVHRLSGDDSRSLELDSLSLVRDDGAFSVDGVTEGIDDTTEQT